MVDIWRELSKVGIYPCLNDDFYELDGHDPSLDPDIIRSYYFRCFRLENGSQIYDISISVCQNGTTEVTIHEIPVSSTKLGAMSEITKIEAKVRDSIRLFLESQEARGR